MRKILLIVLPIIIIGCSKPQNEIMFGLEVNKISSFLINLADTTDESIENVISNAQGKAYEAISNGFDFIDVFEYEVKKDKMNLSEYYHGYGNTNDKIINNLRIKTDIAIGRVVEILQARLDKSEAAGYSIKRERQYRIVIELAGVKNVDRIRTLLTAKGLLEFYLVQNSNNTNELIKKLDDVAIPMDKTWSYRDDDESYRYYSIYHVSKNPEMTGKFIKKASPDFSSLDGSEPKKAMVSLKMNSEGSKIWSGVTGENIGQQIIVTLDNKVLMKTTIHEKNYDGRITIEGFADINEAKDVSSVLRIGPLPISTVIVEERTFEDYKEALNKGYYGGNDSFVKRPFSQIYDLFGEDNDSTTVSELFGEENESFTVSELFGGTEEISIAKGLFSSLLKSGIGKILISEEHIYKFKKLLSNKDYQKILNNYNSQFLLSKKWEEFKPSYIYYCDECGDGISGQPYQCILYMCRQPKEGQVASGLETFCSCSCGVEHRRKEGFKYECY